MVSEKKRVQSMARYSGTRNSGLPDIAVPKSTGTNAPQYSGISPLYRTLYYTVVAELHRLLHTRTNTQTHNLLIHHAMRGRRALKTCRRGIDGP